MSRRRDADATDPEDVSRFIERFASDLVDAGLPRMPARVFVALLAVDEGCLTAAELAQRLTVSPAAVSAAVRYLDQVSLVRREREPGTRRDLYRVHDNAWYEAMLQRDQLLGRWERTLAEGVDLLHPHSPAGRRIIETMAFISFLREEMPPLLQRWRERARSLG